MNDRDRGTEVHCKTCDCVVEVCAFCERADCPVVVCFGCMQTSLGQAIPQPHTHGG